MSTQAEEHEEEFKKLVIEKAYEAGLRRAILNYSPLQLSDNAIKVLVTNHCQEDFQKVIYEEPIA